MQYLEPMLEFSPKVWAVQHLAFEVMLRRRKFWGCLVVMSRGRLRQTMMLTAS
jgi:hypothetical protein